LNRASGLYRTRGTVISYHTLYGVSPEVYKSSAREMAKLFTAPNAHWNTIDATCKREHIKIIIFADTDESWLQIPDLIKDRQPIFTGKYYSAFECGK